MLNAYKTRATEPDVVEYLLRLKGAGAAAMTKEVGAGMTVTRTGAGAHTITWTDNPGVFLGWSCALGAATPADVAGHTVIRDTYTASSKTLPFVVYNASVAAHDLEATEYLDIVVRFRTTAVAGA